MIHVKNGSLFQAQGMMIHGVNCMGVMGAGVAKEVKARWPESFREYRSMCYRVPYWSENLGKILPTKLLDERILIHAFTQIGYGKDNFASYDAIEECFKAVVSMMEVTKPGLNEINFPMIGCGLGKRTWRVVESIIETVVPDVYTKNLWIPN